MDKMIFGRIPEGRFIRSLKVWKYNVDEQNVEEQCRNKKSKNLNIEKEDRN